MAEGEQKAYGHLRFEGDLNGLSSILSPDLVKATIRESCHYVGRQYLLISALGGEVRIEAVSPKEFIMHYELPEDEVGLFCELVSGALCEADVVHEIELHDGQGELMRMYRHE